MYYVVRDEVTNQNELYHYGTLGMKWGRRLYQNKDGTLTALGKKREQKIEEDYKNLTGKNVKKVVAGKQKGTKTTKTDATTEKKPEGKKSVSEMTDAELKKANARMKEEEDYYKHIATLKDYTAKKVELTKGQKFVEKSQQIVNDAISEAAKQALTKFLKKQFGDLLGVDMFNDKNNSPAKDDDDDGDTDSKKSSKTTDSKTNDSKTTGSKTNSESSNGGESETSDTSSSKTKSKKKKRNRNKNKGKKWGRRPQSSASSTALQLYGQYNQYNSTPDWRDLMGV